MCMHIASSGLEIPFTAVYHDIAISFMSVCKNIFVCVCIKHPSPEASIHTRVDIHTQTHTAFNFHFTHLCLAHYESICVCIHMDEYVHTYTYTHIHTYKPALRLTIFTSHASALFISLYGRIYIHTNIHIHAYTYIQTCSAARDFHITCLCFDLAGMFLLKHTQIPPGTCFVLATRQQNLHMCNVYIYVCMYACMYTCSNIHMFAV
jgi:hypothetical protein